MNISQRVSKTIQDDGFILFLIKSSLAVLLLFVVRVGKFFPTSSDNILILFGEKQGMSYAGNGKHLFEWILKNKPDKCDAVWLTRNEAIYDDLASRDLPVEYIESVSAIHLTRRANALCFTHSSRDLLPIHIYPHHTLNVHLGHGHPVKYDNKPGPKPKYSKKAKGIDIFVVESEFLKEVHHKRFPSTIPDEKYSITGYPRNDALLEPSADVATEWERFKKSKQFRIEQTILYAPTQRQPNEINATSTVDLFPFDDFRFDVLQEFLENSQSILLIKLHPSDLKRLENGIGYPTVHATDSLETFIEMLAGFERIEIIDSDHMLQDSNELLPFIHVLVTDYSSIYHDFLLLNRPMLFIPYDYTTFKQDFGFGYNYRDHLPGPEITSFDEFINTLSNLDSPQNDYQEQRTILRNQLHEFQDGRSSQRVWEVIETRI